jgi:mRNA interferase RelE/StbE
MKTRFALTFSRDLGRIRDKAILNRVRSVIEQYEQIDSVSDARQLKKLKGEDGFYRIRVGDYRIGVTIEDGVITFVRFLHRKDLYRYFP